MILEAFASYLKAADQDLPATYILARWLWERLSLEPVTQVDRVLHEEIAVKHRDATNKDVLVYRPNIAPAAAHSASQALAQERERQEGPVRPGYVFEGLSASGQKLLNSLYHYALSWDQQKWARFVHGLKASDFQQN